MWITVLILIQNPRIERKKYKSFLLINQPKFAVNGENFGQAHYKNGIDLLSPPKKYREILQYCPCFAIFRPILPTPDDESRVCIKYLQCLTFIMWPASPNKRNSKGEQQTLRREDINCKICASSRTCVVAAVAPAKVINNNYIKIRPRRKPQPNCLM